MANRILIRWFQCDLIGGSVKETGTVVFGGAGNKEGAVSFVEQQIMGEHNGPCCGDVIIDGEVVARRNKHNKSNEFGG